MFVLQQQTKQALCYPLWQLWLLLQAQAGQAALAAALRWFRLQNKKPCTSNPYPGLQTTTGERGTPLPCRWGISKSQKIPLRGYYSRASYSRASKGGLRACLGISGTNGNEENWGGGISIISQNFSKSPSILFHPLDYSISQTSPKGL
jgi:hypothetical protein